MKTFTGTGTDAGSYIDKPLVEHLRKRYELEFPEVISSVRITKTLILRVLSMHKKVSGIRFMYGLADTLNPNSLRILLVPCTHVSEHSIQAKPIIFSSGYYSHDGKLNSIKQVVELSANFVQFVESRMTGVVHKKITRGGFFGRSSLCDLMQDDRCFEVLFALGLEHKDIKPILEPITMSDQSLSIYMDFAHLCPPSCNTGEDCVATMSVELHAPVYDELDLYRHFRDNELLKLNGGRALYEMYYFISPLIASIIKGKPNRTEILQHIYVDLIAPFKLCLLQKKYDEAFEILRNAFETLIEQYEGEFSTKNFVDSRL